MVRQKSRWLIVRFDFEENVKAGTQAPGNTIDKKVIYFALQELIYETFGIVQAGILEDLQGKTQRFFMQNTILCSAGKKSY